MIIEENGKERDLGEDEEIGLHRDPLTGEVEAVVLKKENVKAAEKIFDNEIILIELLCDMEIVRGEDTDLLHPDDVPKTMYRKGSILEIEGSSAKEMVRMGEAKVKGSRNGL